jgi:two-component system response regulator YesN
MILSVMMADDERVIIRGLKKLIDWDRLGLTLIGEVYKGDALLKGIIEHTPDIVITDISMPGLNGIEVLKELRKLGLQTKVIFISAYREFSYAKDALSYGAVDYLIKPIDRKKLDQLLITTVNDIHESSALEMNNNRLLHYEVKHKRQMIEDFLENLTEEKKLSYRPELVRELEGDELSACFSVIVVEVDHSSKHSGSWLGDERKLIYFAIQNIMEDLIPQRAVGWTITNRSYLYMVLRHEQAFDVAKLAAQFHRSINHYLKLSVTIGIGTPEALGQIPKSYNQAKLNLSYKFFLGVNRMITSSSLQSVPNRIEVERDKLERELLKGLRSLHNDSKPVRLEDWLQLITSLAWGNRDYALNLGNSLLLKALHEFSIQSANIELEEQRYVQQLNECETLEEMNDFIQSELKLLQMKAHQRGISKEALQMLQVKAYIDEHYQEEINLGTMAARFYMNPSYFSTFFKKHTGQNFKPYVTEIRMKHAMQLLTQTDAMLYEIAENVGYNNARQFSELFKKTYGTLPNDYRKSMA